MTGSGMYFSPAEFIVMLELAGSRQCLLLFQQDEPDDNALAQAFASLFRRGLIRRDGDRFRVSGAGELFAQMRSAPFAVLVSGPKGQENRAICYTGGDGICLVEPVDAILQRQYRVRRLTPGQLCAWLFETRLLEPPVLREEDVAEWDAALEREHGELPGDVLLRMEKHENGGGLADTFEVRRRRGERLTAHIGPEGRRLAVYTVESLRLMLEECFGKENHDHC